MCMDWGTKDHIDSGLRITLTQGDKKQRAALLKAHPGYTTVFFLHVLQKFQALDLRASFCVI